MNQILLLHKAKRWQEMLDSVQAVMEKFPQTKPQNDRDRLRWYINDAKRNLKKASGARDSKVGP